MEGDGVVPVYDQNESIDMSLDELRSDWKESIFRIAARRGASRVRVFGSVARGENDENSDIDFLVDLEPGRTLFDLSGLLADLQALLHQPVDVVTEKGLRPKIRERVVGEAIAL